MPEAGTLRTPVFLAIKQSNIELLEVLVENLTKDQITDVVNRSDRSGITPLSLCRERCVAIIGICFLPALSVVHHLKNGMKEHARMSCHIDEHISSGPTWSKKRRQEEHLEVLAWIMQHGAKYEQG